jgi:hypothetical protein
LLSLPKYNELCALFLFSLIVVQVSYQILCP